MKIEGVDQNYKLVDPDTLPLPVLGERVLNVGE